VIDHRPLFTRNSVVGLLPLCVIRLCNTALIITIIIMPSIEYSPNSRAGCQGCHGKIPEGKVRVGSKAQSQYSKGDMMNK
jgi:hypothetical protein